MNNIRRSIRQILHMYDTPDLYLLVEPSLYHVACTFCSKSRRIYNWWWLSSSHASLDGNNASSIAEINHLWTNDHE